MRPFNVRDSSKPHVQYLSNVPAGNAVKVGADQVPSSATEAVDNKSPLTQESGAGVPGTPALPNPGLYEDLHKATRDLFPQVFEGTKLVVSKGISSHFQVSHTLALGAYTPYLYRFGTTYIGTKHISQTEAFPVLLGDFDTYGNVNAHIIHAITDRLRLKLLTQFQPTKCVNNQLSFDYKGDNFSVALTTGNLDPINLTGMLVCHYLQSIAHGLALGAELLYQRGTHVPGGEIGVMSVAGRWAGPWWALSANISPMTGNLHACMYKKLHEYFQVGIELETNTQTSENTTTVVSQVDIPALAVTFRGQVDNNWFFSAVLEKKLAPLPVMLTFSGCVNRLKNYYRWGVGVVLG